MRCPFERHTLTVATRPFQSEPISSTTDSSITSLMATSSRKSNLAEVGKISLSILEAVSGEIPPPGEAIVKLVSQVVAAVEVSPTLFATACSSANVSL